MKKWLIGSMIAVLIGTCPMGVYAANESYNNKLIEVASKIAQSAQGDNNPVQKKYGKKGRDHFHRQPKRWEHSSREREDARYIIHRTAEVIFQAQRHIRLRHYSFGMATVIAHQQLAYELYWKGFYQSAIFHSLRARRLATEIILRNGGNWLDLPASWDEREEQYGNIAPRDNELDSQLDKNRIGNDDDAVDNMLNLDIAN